MGGQSSQQQQSQTVSQPWAPTQSGLQGIIGQITGQLGNTGVNPTEMNAFNTLSANAAGGNPYANPISGYATNLLQGGGANAQAGNVQNNLDAFKATLNPWVTNIGDPSQNPALRAMLDTIRSDTTNSINSQFASAGRDLSGLNQQAVSRGIAQGEAPTLLNAQQTGLNAAGNLYNAGNTTSGILSGLNQTGLANQGVGVGAADQALQAQNWGPQQQLAIQQALRGLPVNSIGALASLLVPIAGLGGQTNSQSSGTQQMSGAQQFGMIAGGLNNLLPTAKWLSDRRLKKDIVRIGALENGLPFYRFKYNWSDEEQIGLMADEVEKIHPEAVIHGPLYDMVDYERAVL